MIMEAGTTLDDRTPAHWSAEAELAVLGGLLNDGDVARRFGPAIPADNFYRPGNRLAKLAMDRIMARGDVIDPVTLAEELRKDDALEAVGGLQFIASVLDAVPSSVNTRYHIGIVNEKAELRAIAEAQQRAAALIARPGKLTPMEVLAEVRGYFAAVKTASGGDGMVSIGDRLWEAMDDLQKIGTPEEERGIQTGYRDVDHMIGGLRKGELIVVAARPSMGKSAYATGIAAAAGIEQQQVVALFSQETKVRGLVRRILSGEALLDVQKARQRGAISEADIPQLSRAAGLLKDAPIYLDDTPGLTIPQMRDKMARLEDKLGRKIGLVIQDYMGKMRAPKAKDRYREVSEISNGLKDTALEFDVPLVALSQLSRAVEQRPDKKPMMSDLRESGEIEQDADAIMLLHRPEYYHGPVMKVGKAPDVQEINVEERADVIIGKQRDGATGTVTLRFRKECTRFEDWDQFSQR